MSEETVKNEALEEETLSPAPEEKEIPLEEMTRKQLRSLVEYYKTKAEAGSIEGNQEKIAAAEKAAEEYKDKWMRLAAEFDNYKKRNARLRVDSLQEGRGEMVVKILPIGDNLDRALKMDVDEGTLKGLEMLKRSFSEVLTSVGVTETSTKGEKFDPTLHEAVMQVPTEDETADDTIAEVYTKGYKLGDKIIRYAQVSVYKA